MRHPKALFVYSFRGLTAVSVCKHSNLFIDDFLAFGNAAMGIIELAKQSGAHIAGMGFIIEKAFQDGGKMLRDQGIHVESLAIIDSLDDCKIQIRNEQH